MTHTCLEKLLIDCPSTLPFKELLTSSLSSLIIKQRDLHPYGFSKK
jgi:hypothetical protein